MVKGDTKMTEAKLIKKEIFSYAIFIAIIALICIFKNEILGSL